MPFAIAALDAISVAFVLACAILCFRPKQTLAFMNTNSEAIKIGLATVAALYTAWVYFIEMRDNRIANTLALQEQAASTYLRSSFDSLNMFWIRGPGEVSLRRFRRDASIPMNGVQYTRLDDEFALKTKNLVRSHQLEDEILAIHGFYREVVVCVEQGRCHEETACQLFANDIESFRLIYRTFVDDWDVLWETGVSTRLMDFHYDCTYRPVSDYAAFEEGFP